MPLRIQNKEMARVKAMESLIYREPDPGATFGAYVDPIDYHHGQLPMYVMDEMAIARRRSATSGLDEQNPLEGKPVFKSRVPGGKLFGAAPNGSESPCVLNMLDILSVQRHWCVMEHQDTMKGTMGKKFHVTAEEARRQVDQKGTTHDSVHLALRDKQSLTEEVPLTYLSDSMIERCNEASHSHVPSYHFPMGTKRAQHKLLMAAAHADSEVAQINTANDRGHGDLRNESANVGITPIRLVSRRSKSPEKLSRAQSSLSMMSSGTMMAERRFASPGLPEEGFDNAGFINRPMGLPHITFSKKPKPAKLKSWMTRRGSLSTVKSKGWNERDMTRSLSAMA